jgi:nitrogen fixation NifU-like protein
MEVDVDPALRELYQQVILDHQKRPRNFRSLARAERQAEGYNPLCGDRIKVELRLDGGKIGEIGFTGAGCAICTASASMMTEAVAGKPASEATRMFDSFRDVVMGKTEAEDAADALGKLAAFAGVREFPIRVKCATLPWHTLQAALENRPGSVSTE